MGSQGGDRRLQGPPTNPDWAPPIIPTRRPRLALQLTLQPSLPARAPPLTQGCLLLPLHTLATATGSTRNMKFLSNCAFSLKKKSPSDLAQEAGGKTIYGRGFLSSCVPGPRFPAPGICLAPPQRQPQRGGHPPSYQPGPSTHPPLTYTGNLLLRPCSQALPQGTHTPNCQGCLILREHLGARRASAVQPQRGSWRQKHSLEGRTGWCLHNPWAWLMSRPRGWDGEAGRECFGLGRRKVLGLVAQY